MASIMNVSTITFERFYGDGGLRGVASLSQNGARLSSAQAPIGSVIASTDCFGSPIVVVISSVVENSLKSGDISKTLFNVRIARTTPDFARFLLGVRETVATEHASETEFNSAKSQGHIPAKVPNNSVPATTSAPAGTVVSNLAMQAESFV